jgi:hypothetical protein
MSKGKKKFAKVPKKYRKLVKAVASDIQANMAARSQREAFARVINTLAHNREVAFKKSLTRMGGR